MTFNIQTLLKQKSLESKQDIDMLYRAGMKNVIDNIEYYFDKPYSCESVLRELFERGINKFIEKEKPNRF
jgi:hypothetical protein